MGKSISILFILVCALGGLQAMAQMEDIVIMDGNKGFSTQHYFYSGPNNPFPEDKIEKYWDKGERITAISNGASGWCVAVSGNSGIGRQTYSYKYEWPKDFISRNWKEGYRITQAVHDGNKWAVVMSEDSKGVDQNILTCKTEELGSTINKCWTNGYHVSILTSYEKDNWLIIGDKYHPYGAQGYEIEHSYDAIKQQIRKRWDEGYTLKILEKSDNVYVAVMTRYQDDPKAVQSFYNVLDENYIKEQWNKRRDIAYFGSGKSFATPSSSYSAANNSRQQNGYNLPRQGERSPLLASDKGNYCSISRFNMNGPNQESLFMYSWDGIQMTSWSFWHGSGVVYAHTETTDDYYILRKYFYKQNPSAYDIYSSWSDQNDYLKFSRKDGSITTKNGERYYLPINEEQKKNLDQHLNNLIRMAEGNYIPPVNNNGSNSKQGNGTSKSRCNWCNGTGVCSSCKGKGGYADYYGYSADKTWRTCPSCNGSGKCFNCHGKGNL